VSPFMVFTGLLGVLVWGRAIGIFALYYRSQERAEDAQWSPNVR